MEFCTIITNRRAINFFDPKKEVSDVTLRSIIELASNAPSSFNLQPWKIKILRKLTDKIALRERAFDQPKITEAPVIVMILADKEGWQEQTTSWNRQLQEGLSPNQKEWFTSTTTALYGSTQEAACAFANKNAGLFAMSLMYAASEYKLHTHPMDGFDHEKVRTHFNIPARYWIPMLIAIGHVHPNIQEYPKKWRQSYAELTLLEK